ncbi:hypothetical protein BB427_07385 [Pseudoalteromonas sp. BMB]|uniref:DUF484 family protein n=1 Tax=Pseudoalteromonas sp. BMB TaxID=1874619 RepID=UPI00083D321E|nr:DUF484 family protein [Pseudoalteromonas sp. BMB]ODB43499.1 hypothetical protein BB427_07385 [Pseudoalteromonas sp. BMB]
MTIKEANSTEQLVIEYLRKHPDFLLRHPYVLLDLQLHHQQQGLPNLALHQQRMLRDEVNSLQQQIKDMVHYAKANELVFKQLSECQLAIMRCTELSAINHTLAQRFEDHPDIQACKLINIDDTLLELVSAKLSSNNSYLGRLSQTQAELLFADIEVGSVALYRVDASDKGRFILAFASRSPEHFSPQHDNMLITAFIQTLSLKLEALA